MMNDTSLYRAHSRFTDPGALAGRLDAIPGDLRSLQAAARRLVFHYRGDGDWGTHQIAAERLAEIDTRYAERMFRRLFELQDAPLTAERPPHRRLVGCCRDFTVLFLALARHEGLPARARVGFATYFVAGWHVDHEIAEVWDAATGCWHLVDPELHEGHTDPNDGMTIDPLDIPRDRFIAAPAAWQSCRAGATDPARFVVAPALDIPMTRSWPQLVHNLLHDLAALNRREMLLWDNWGLAESDQWSAEQLALLDQLAAALSTEQVTHAALQEWYGRAEFRVPPIVTSYSPAAASPLRIEMAAQR